MLLRALLLSLSGLTGGFADAAPAPKNLLLVGLAPLDREAFLQRLALPGRLPGFQALGGARVDLKCQPCPEREEKLWISILSGMNPGRYDGGKAGAALSLDPEESLFARIRGLKPREPRHEFFLGGLAIRGIRPRPVAVSGEQAIDRLGIELDKAKGRPFTGVLLLAPPGAAPGSWEAEDARVARLIQALRVRGLFENTLLILLQPAGRGRGKGFALGGPSAFTGLRAQGSYRDLLPTLLASLGGDPSGIRPKPQGEDLHLFESERADLQASPTALRVAYFFGVRTALLYRAYASGRLEEQGLELELYSRYLDDNSYHLIPRAEREIGRRRVARFGKAKGEELIDRMLEGRFQAATVGETAFLKAVAAGRPVVAVAELAHDRPGEPGRCVALRSGLSYTRPADLKGRVFISKRSSGGDTVFLREFFSHEGLDPDKDVRIIADFRDDRMEAAVRSGSSGIAGGLFHLSEAARLMRKKALRVISKFDWLDPEMSQALLVVPKASLPKERERLVGLIRSLMEQERYERGLSPEERLRYRRKKGRQLDDSSIGGMNLPQMSLVPLVREEKLRKMGELLVKHRVLKRVPELNGFYDNSLVLQAEAALPKESP